MTLDPLSRLASHSTAAVSDALDELGVNGYLPGIVARRHDQGRVAGHALPVRFTPKADDPGAYRFGGGVGKPLEQVLKTMADGDIVVIDLGGSDRAAAWGGLASRLAQRRGVRGTVMWGCCRDVEEIRAIGYPVWSAHVSPRRSRNDFTFGSVNETISIGSVTIGPKDYMLADADGVLCIPRAHIGAVLDLADRVEMQERALEAQVINDAVTSWDAI